MANRTAVNLADDAVVIEPRHLAGLATKNSRHRPRCAPLSALRRCGYGPRIRHRGHSHLRPDPTDAQPQAGAVATRRLGHVPKENFVIINGLGSNRANTRDELILMLGEQVVDTIRIENHDRLRQQQTRPRGLQHLRLGWYFLNKTYVEATFKIAPASSSLTFRRVSGGP
jgi:hypothetical protein